MECHTAADLVTGVSYAFPVNPTTASSQLLVSFTVEHKQGSTVVTTTPYTNVPVSAIPTLVFHEYGDYIVTVSAVSDRISRKSSVDGIIDTTGDTFTYSVLKPAQTGPAYRIPNRY
jgi:hypothetical protein